MSASIARRLAIVPLVFLVFLVLPASAAAAATVSGRVTHADAPVAGASIYLGALEARTGDDGGYSIEQAPPGAQVLIVFKEGYRTETRNVEVPATGDLSQDFALEEDLLYSDSLVVTGTRNPLTKRESSVAITTLDETQIDERAPRSTADLLKVVPGFYVESSGGEVGGNLFARGMPADGSYRYVALMEDGMPVYDATELSFVNADIFVRVDEMVSEVEAVRGGNSSLFGSNAPGGVINFLSHTGGPEPATRAKFTVGSDGYWRIGFLNSGPIAEDWTYSIGGFYRYDEGIRDPGFPASDGGQLRFNLTRNLDNGYVRIYGKYLNDSNIFYLPVPFKAGSGLDFVSGFPSDGTLTTPEGNQVTVPRPNQQGLLTLPLDDGQRQEGYSVMGELSFELGNGWLLENMARVMSIDHTWNAVVPFDLFDVDTEVGRLVPNLAPGSSVELSFTNVDQPFSTQNDLLLEAGLWHIEKPMTSFSNQFQLSKTVGSDVRHELSAGTYVSHYTADNVWYFNDILTDVRTQPHFVDVTVVDAAGNRTDVTKNGFRRYGSLFVNATGNVDVAAFFAGDQIQLNDRLRIDIGGRYESNKFRQTDENTANFDLGDPTTPVDDAVGGGTGTFRRVSETFNEWALSAGANFLLNDNVALWGRASRGYKMPILDNYLFGGGNLEAEEIVQAEVGAKIGTPTLGLNVSAYDLTVSNFPSQDARIVNGEPVFVTDFVGEAETIGLETELVARPWKNLRINLVSTLQQPEYNDFTEGDGDVRDGKRIRRIPQEVTDLTVGYDWSKTSVAANYNHYGKRFANASNTIELPDFGIWTFTGSHQLTARLGLEAAVVNAFDDNGLTEGNPRLDEDSVNAGAVFLARPVLPRRFTVSLDFRF